MEMEAVVPTKETTDIILQEGGNPLELCYQCGLCTGVCPWNMVRDFSLRKLLHKTQMGLIDFEDEDLWRCTNCYACVKRCPRGVEVPHIMRAMRRVVMEVGAGKAPESFRITVKNIASVGNPLGEPPEKRMDWAKFLGVKTFTKGTEYLYFPCCYQAYDLGIQRVLRAAVYIMNKANVDFGIPGNNVGCCGESVRNGGAESLWHNLAETNIKAFTELGVKKIVVTSPHCYLAFKNDYPELGGNFEVVHISQLLAGLIKEGKLKFTKPVNKRVTLHDTCCVGRREGMYDEPRLILNSIPGLELVEMRDSREYSLCCGGGCMGRIWMETKKGERFSDIRLEQALETKAGTLSVYCPYCMLNFDDTVLVMDKGNEIEIKDILELASEAM
jgi:Fe-S oxidoreductase